MVAHGKADQNLARLFRASPTPLLVLAPDTPRFTIIEVNDAYLAATMRTREGLIGAALFAAFPDNPADLNADGVSNLRASLERVLASGRPDDMPIQKYDIPHPDGAFEERWWKPVNSAVPGEAGEVEMLIHQVTDVTAQYRADEALVEHGQQSRLLSMIVEFSNDAIITKNLAGVITSWNAAAQRVFGYDAEEAIGKPITLLIPQDRLGEEPAILERIRQGELIEHFETVRQRKDGGLIDISLTISPLRDQHGEITGASKIARDITERLRAERLVATLAREAEHRTKNVLARVQATVQLSNGATVAELKEVIGGRLQALADVNSLFVQSRWAGADIRKIVAQELAPYGEDKGGRVSLTGPDILLEPEAAQTLAVTLHELATNAAKYGALSVDQGKVDVEWTFASDSRLEVRWTESNGPTIRAPTRRGFGTRVMQGMVAARGGALEFRWKPSGLLCEIIMST